MHYRAHAHSVNSQLVSTVPKSCTTELMHAHSVNSQLDSAGEDRSTSITLKQIKASHRVQGSHAVMLTLRYFKASCDTPTMLLVCMWWPIIDLNSKCALSGKSTRRLKLACRIPRVNFQNKTLFDYCLLHVDTVVEVSQCLSLERRGVTD